MPRLADKAAVITGGAGGIGIETARLFLREGAKVALVDLDQGALDEAANALEGDGKVVALTADVSKEEDVRNYVKQARDRLGRIDIFFNNAGIEGAAGPITRQKIEDFDKVMAVNVRGAFLGLKYVLQVMEEQASGGSIVNMSSVAGLTGSPDLAPYIISKHAVLGMTRAAALEVAAKGIRVNSVHPAPINTRMMRSIESGMDADHAEDVRKAYAKAIPMQRYSEAAEVAQVVLFLASDDASYVTGAHYTVDGGMTPN